VLGISGLTVDGESFTTWGTPEVDISGVNVRLPPGGFFQASREAEAVMANLVAEGSMAAIASRASCP
jgi:23S rRNA (uracil1939-C5)-methyltransferase